MSLREPDKWDRKGNIPPTPKTSLTPPIAKRKKNTDWNIIYPRDSPSTCAIHVATAWAIFVSVVTLILAIMFGDITGQLIWKLIEFANGDTQPVPVWADRLLGVGSGIIIWTFFWIPIFALLEIVHLFVWIERNTREAKDHLEENLPQK